MNEISSEMQNLVIEKLRPEDTARLLKLAVSIDWGLSPARVLTFLHTSVGFGHVSGDHLLSSTLNFRYGQELTFVGLVIVHPQLQHRGLGREIFRHCLEFEGDSRIPTALIATDAGYPLYYSEGFRTVEMLHRFIGLVDREPFQKLQEDVHSDILKQIEVVPFCDAYMNDILRLDYETMGTNRSRLYPGFLTSALIARVALSKDGSVCGFGTATRFGTEMLSIGPLMAKDDAVAVKLAVHLIGEWTAQVRFDVPDCQAGWMKTLSELNIPEVHQSPLLLRGGTKLPGRRNGLYSIMDAAVG